MLTLALALTAQASTPAPRSPLPPIDIVVPEAPDSVVGRLQVGIKLVDSARGRAQSDGTLAWTGIADAGQIDTFARLSADLRFSQRIHLSPQRLAAFEARAAQRSKREQPDLAGILDVHPSTDRTATDLGELARRLQSHPLVEYAFVRPIGTPPPGDISPETGDYTDCQGYLGSDPGIDADFAAEVGATGSHLRLSDCEYGWDQDHEDLMDRDLRLEPGQTVPGWVEDYGYDDHGTAVIGQTSAVDNGYGVTGAVPDAATYTWPEYSVEEESRRLTAIVGAIDESDAGDVVLLEMQVGVICGACYGPAELDPDVWTVVRAGVDAGVVVVGAAGNGAQDLDDDWYADNYGTWGDSGAIIVGAGTADTRHATLYFSTFGERVDLQGWGERVCSTGYGDFRLLGGDPHQAYTSDFAGTSSASPIVASAAVAVQDYVVAHRGTPLSPEDLRALLVDTGIPGTGDPIGAFPDVRAAILTLDADLDGHLHPDFGGDDCEDDEPLAHPGAEEVWYDGVDGDCAGDDDFDQDADGHASAEHGGDDCDDTDPGVNPTLTPDADCAGGDVGGGGDGGGGGGKATTCSTAAATVAWLPLVLAGFGAVRRRASRKEN